jgi:SAM-dependent methyltransferase
MWERFDRQTRQHEFHPFVPADYQHVLAALFELRASCRSFLELGSGTGIVSIMADLVGFDSSGIEIDPALVDQARALAVRYGSSARFVTGSFLPEGYTYHAPDGDRRTGTISEGQPAYGLLGRTLRDFDLVYAFPWCGEEPLLQDLMRRHGAEGARLLLYHHADGVMLYRDGQLTSS